MRATGAQVRLLSDALWNRISVMLSVHSLVRMLDGCLNVCLDVCLNVWRVFCVWDDVRRTVRSPLLLA